MAFFSRLFGRSETTRIPEELYALEEFRKEIDQEITLAEMLDKVHQIIADFGGVMSDTLDAGMAKRPPIYLHSESVLPYPKDTIRLALQIFLGYLENRGKEEMWGFSKNALGVVALALETHFASDEEIPDDPRLNGRAHLERTQKVYPYIQKKYEDVRNEIKNSQERIPGILKRFGKWEDLLKSLNP